MENPQAVSDYRLDVTDFGPISEASVDLRPLTIFIGPSNTGKSYLAVLIYALQRCLGGQGEGGSLPAFQFLRSWPLGLPIDLSREAEGARALIGKSVKEWLSKGEEYPLSSLPKDVQAHIISSLEQAKGLNHSLEREIRRCFGVDDLGKMVRRPDGPAAASIGIEVPHNTGPLRYQLKIGQGALGLSGQLPKKISVNPTSIRKTVERFAIFREEEDDLSYLAVFLVRAIFHNLLQPMLRDVYYLPADRTGVMHSHQVVVSTLIQNATTAGLRPSRNVPMLSGVLADFLSQLIDISGARNPFQEATDRGEIPLERSILRGRVRLDRSDSDYPIFAYRPNGWEEDLPLMRASSMVSELAPVVLYLRHLVQPDNVLIIEEPEAHLHPAMQTALARELARLVRSGVRIVLTTHSEWFLEKIGNLTRLSELPKEKRTSIENEDVALDPHEVGAWLFKPPTPPKGSVVEEVKIDPETGLFSTDYSEVSETLYNEGAQIFNRLQEGDEE